MMKDAQAFIFDLDGTLVDSLQDITGALNDALAALARPTASTDQVRAWVGDGLMTLCRRALPADDSSASAELARLAKIRYQSHCADHTRSYPNILPMLKLLKSGGARLAVLSNKPHDLTIEVMERLALRGYFDEIRGCSREEDRKPAPRIAREVARRLAAEPRNVFFVGDSQVDIATARNAGLIAVAVTWGFQSRDELLGANPDFLVDDPLELLELSKRRIEPK